MSPFPWHALEQLSSRRGTAAVWHGLLGDVFEAFQSAFLQKLADRAAGVFCERCYCTHEVVLEETVPHRSTTPLIHHSASTIIAACRCPDINCPDIHLTPADVELWALSWPRLGRALCRALGIPVRLADLKLFNTHQIGAWSADAVPVILTIQSERHQLSSIISQLSSRLRRAFILLAPTGENLDALAQEFLANAGAEFFAVENLVRFGTNSELLAVKSGGELFARFNPDTKAALEEDTARQAFALVKSLDAEGRQEPPTPLTVFCGYCIEGFSISELVKKLKCSRTTIVRRLRLIRKRTGIDPEALRQLSPHLEKIRNDLSDPRASRISARRAIYDEDVDFEE